MHKYAVALLISFLLALPAAPNIPAVFAASAAPDASSDNAGYALTDEEKTLIAGTLLTDVMDLILEQYAGGEVTPEDLYEAALRGISDILDDYSGYLDEDDWQSLTGALSGKLTGIGVVMRRNTDNQAEIMRVLPDSPAAEGGIRRGDIILAVNGRPAAGLTLDEITAMILDPAITEVSMEMQRGTEKESFRLVKREIASATVYTDRIENILGPSYADMPEYRYVSIGSIASSTPEDLRTAIAALKKEGVTHVVLDLRGNSGGYLDAAVDICAQIVPKGPVTHIVTPDEEKRTVYSSLVRQPFQKIAVLTDRDTASAAELITAALQDAKAATVFGETTFGKGVIQTVFPLPTGGGIKLTTEEYLRPNGGRINEIGVKPDIAVAMRPADYETENDEALIKAAEWLRSK